MGIESDCVVLSVGLLAFDGDRDYTFHELMKRGRQYKFDIKSQLKAGRTTDQSTLDWWKLKADEAQFILKPNPTIDIPHHKIVDCFDEYFNDMNVDVKNAYFFCRGMDFDFCILKDLCRKSKKPVPMPYYNVRDIRSILHALAGKSGAKMINKIEPPDGYVKHDALSDCCLDYIKIKTAQDLSGKKVL